MKSIGIIAEYNPFHNGHLYHLTKIKEKYPNHTIILVMNGNFTERGDVCIIDKWSRSEIAIKAGIDLIIELPFPFATQSADYFSYGAITILEKLKVERVIFGSECNDLDALQEIATAQLYNEDFDKLVKIYSKLGNNYPTALSLALNDLTGKTISTPNDLLGISYIKTIKKYNYNIIPETIKRTSSYHEKELIDNMRVSKMAGVILKEFNEPILIPIIPRFKGFYTTALGSNVRNNNMMNLKEEIKNGNVLMDPKDLEKLIDIPKQYNNVIMDAKNFLRNHLHLNVNDF